MRSIARRFAVIATIMIGVSALVTPSAMAVTRQDVLRNARVWLTANNGGPVPYDQGRNWTDGYRQDCSGFVSMAARLSKPGLTTVDLYYGATRAIPQKSMMRPGDLFIDKDGDGDNRHVVIFEKWYSSAMVSYWAYEQRGGRGTDYRVLNYGLSPGSEYQMRRFNSFPD